MQIPRNHSRGTFSMRKHLVTAAILVLFASCLASAQDAMKYGVKHLTLLAEDDKVRVLHFTPHKGDKTPIHSHPATVLYVIKGGKIKTTLPDGSSSITDLVAGKAILRPPVVHEDEALDDLDVILVELKK
jgi:quercetin dioxygenase-like cupin family protein